MDNVKSFRVQRIVIVASHTFWEGYLKRQMEAKEFANA